MIHLLDHAAHAAVRGAIYRVMWHSPVIVALALVALAALFIVRRNP